METTTAGSDGAQKQIGPYLLVREAGRGAMSTVYEATDTRIGRKVAVKLIAIPPYLSPEQREQMTARVRREIRTIGRLSHPHIVTIYDVGEQDGLHYIVMEFLQGQTLRERLDSGAPLSLEEVAAILDQVAEGLDVVHAVGVVHRDIKPSNVMLLPNNRVKLMDFGVARQADDTTVTHTGVTVGSPAYMAPEQVRGETGTTASDVWAMGALLYEMVAGRAPFSGPSVPSVLYQVAYENPAPVPAASPAIQRLLQRALEKDPAQRFPSARALADAFREAAAGGTAAPAGAPPPRARVAAPAVATAAPPPAQPQRRPSAAVAGALLLLAAGVFGGIYAQRPQTRETAQPSAGATPPAKPPAPVQTAGDTETSERPAQTAEEKAEAAPLVAAVEERPARAAEDEAAREREAEEEKEEKRREREQEAERAQEERARERAKAREEQAKEESRKREEAARERREAAEREAKEKSAAEAAARERRAREEKARAASQEGRAARVAGTWSGSHTGQPATLTLRRGSGNSVSGTMTVQAKGGRTVRVAVSGTVTPQTGAIRLRETRVLNGSPDIWDLGGISGRVSPDGRLTGSGQDTRGRPYNWSFSR